MSRFFRILDKLLGLDGYDQPAEPQVLTRLSPGEYWMSAQACSLLYPKQYERWKTSLPTTFTLDDGTVVHVGGPEQ